MKLKQFRYTKKDDIWGEFVVTQAYPEAMRADAWFKNEAKVPKKLLHHLRMTDGIEIDGQPFSPVTRMNEGTTFALRCFEEEPITEETARPVDVLYEDDHLIVVDKPRNLNVHRQNKSNRDTLIARVANYMGENGE
ncbi:MAG: hypothetical protein ACRC5C_03030, partial [Bacilli bacterium]